MSTNDDHRDLLVAVALGIADPHEVAEVERLIAENPAYRGELFELRSAVAEMALSVPQVEPPSRLKGSIMDAVRAEQPAPQRARAPRTRGRLAWPSWRHAGAWPALAGGFAAVAIGLLTWNLVTGADDPSRGRNLTVQTAAAVPNAVGDARVLSDGTAVVRLSGLPRVPAGKAYELWVIGPKGPVSAGFLGTKANGDLVATAEQLDGATALAITPERIDNTTAPTSTPIVTVALG
jgi:anti-sigma-K factor RskA